MGAIKDLVDLYTQLTKSVTDSKARELLLPYHEKALEVQRENLDERQRSADVLMEQNTRHANEVLELNQIISRLKTENSGLLATLNAKQIPVDAVFSEKTGTHIEKSTGHHYCSKCFDKEKYSPMQVTNNGWKCSVCGNIASDPDKPTIWEFRTPI